jgi:DNA-directed RNA polymerase specialized sigma24 family protein
MALPGYVRTIATRVAAQIRKQYPGRRRHQDVSYAVISHGLIAESPEDCFLRREQRHLAEKLLSRLNTKERELLLRFYLLEQDKEQICRDLSMTENQFRLAKSRAKGKLIARAVSLIGATNERRGSTHSGEVRVA